jgi:hygromycin-B 4-O-kinase
MADDLDSTKIAAFLVDRGWPGTNGIVRIRHGEWSRAFGFRAADDRQYVVRFSALDEDFRKDQLAARYVAPDLPIPAILDIGRAFGGHFAIAARVGGAYLDDLDAAGMRRVLPALFAAIAAMREANIAHTRGFGVWGADGHAPSPTWQHVLLNVARDRAGERLSGWRASLEQSPTGVRPFEATYARLVKLASAVPNARHLIHADLLNYNVLVDGDRLSAVLDWGSAMYGDWLSDIAWLSYWQPWYPAWADIDFAAEAKRYFGQSAEMDFDARVLACELLIGLGEQVYNAWKGPARYSQLEAVAQRTLALL